MNTPSGPSHFATISISSSDIFHKTPFGLYSRQKNHRRSNPLNPARPNLRSNLRVLG